MSLLTGVWALGHRAGTPIHWYTPVLCRLLGELQVDPHNGVRMYTHRGVTLLIAPKTKGGK